MVNKLGPCPWWNPFRSNNHLRLLDNRHNASSSRSLDNRHSASSSRSLDNNLNDCKRRMVALEKKFAKLRAIIEEETESHSPQAATQDHSSSSPTPHPLVSTTEPEPVPDNSERLQNQLNELKIKLDQMDQNGREIYTQLENKLKELTDSISLIQPDSVLTPQEEQQEEEMIPEAGGIRSIDGYFMFLIIMISVFIGKK